MSKEQSSMEASSEATLESLQAQIDELKSQVQSLTSSQSSSGTKLQNSQSQASSEQVSSMSVSSEIQEPKTISLNVETKRGDGTLTFIKFETVPDSHEVIFHYQTSDEKAIMTEVKETFLYGRSGKKYTTHTFGGGRSAGSVIFQNVTDFSDLSHVALAYKFEGYDAVTVEFDIPGI